MKDVTTVFKTEKNKRENQPIVLIALLDYDGAGNNLYFAKYDTEVVFDGITYQKFPIAFDSIKENSGGTIDALRITVCNVSRLIQSYLNDYDGLCGKALRIRIVWANQLSDPDAKLDHIVYIDSVAATSTDVEFTCMPKLSAMDRQLPTEVYLRTHCRYRVFKDPKTCGYTGPETECNRTKQRCKELGNYSRFGGCPSIPSEGFYVI